jgi:hypothetical protein
MQKRSFMQYRSAASPADRSLSHRMTKLLMVCSFGMMLYSIVDTLLPMVEFNRCVAQRGHTSTELRPTYVRLRFSFMLWSMVFDDMRVWLVRNN